MTKTLHFSIIILAPVAQVWALMLDREGYEHWTAAFCEGSTFVGTWDEGQAMRFLAPNGDGMVAEIAQNRRHEFISIRHLGEIVAGVEDTRSDKVRAWAPAYENFAFRPAPGGSACACAFHSRACRRTCASAGGSDKHRLADGLRIGRRLRTPREIEGLCWTMDGKTAWEVGEALGISERTAVLHINNAMHKLGCTNKHQAVLKALRLGLIR